MMTARLIPAVLIVVLAGSPAYGFGRRKARAACPPPPVCCMPTVQPSVPQFYPVPMATVSPPVAGPTAGTQTAALPTPATPPTPPPAAAPVPAAPPVAAAPVGAQPQFSYDGQPGGRPAYYYTYDPSGKLIVQQWMDWVFRGGRDAGEPRPPLPVVGWFAGR